MKTDVQSEYRRADRTRLQQENSTISVLIMLFENSVQLGETRRLLNQARLQTNLVNTGIER